MFCHRKDLFNQAIAAGAKEVMAIEAQFYGDRNASKGCLARGITTAFCNSVW
jgi:hypothetical protein